MVLGISGLWVSHDSLHYLFGVTDAKSRATDLRALVCGRPLSIAANHVPPLLTRPLCQKGPRTLKYVLNYNPQPAQT